MVTNVSSLFLLQKQDNLKGERRKELQTANRLNDDLHNDELTRSHFSVDDDITALNYDFEDAVNALGYFGTFRGKGMFNVSLAAQNFIDIISEDSRIACLSVCLNQYEREGVPTLTPPEPPNLRSQTGRDVEAQP